MSCPGVAWRHSVELLEFLGLLCNFDAKHPPKGESHYGDLRKVLKRNEVHCFSIKAQNIEVAKRVHMGDAIRTNMQPSLIDPSKPQRLPIR